MARSSLTSPSKWPTPPAAAVLGTRCSTTTDSCAACAPSPTAPNPSSVGTPSAAVKLPSEPPPVAASSSVKPSSAASSLACLVERDRPAPAFHRRTVQPARDFELALRIRERRPAKQLRPWPHRSPWHAHVHIGVRMFRDDVRPRAAGDHAWIHCRAPCADRQNPQPSPAAAPLPESPSAPRRSQRSCARPRADARTDGSRRRLCARSARQSCAAPAPAPQTTPAPAVPLLPATPGCRPPRRNSAAA